MAALRRISPTSCPMRTNAPGVTRPMRRRAKSCRLVRRRGTSIASLLYADGEANQLTQWSELGLLSGAPEASVAPRNAVWNDASFSVDTRARAYLDINCAHCHNRVGPADTSGLLLEHNAPVGPSLGLCKPPIAAGKGTGGRVFGIVPGKADQSIFHLSDGVNRPFDHDAGTGPRTLARRRHAIDRRLDCSDGW